jgi:hypothetical protein
MRWVEYVARMWEMRNTYNILAGVSEWKRLIGRIRLTFHDNKNDPKEIGCELVDWINLAEVTTLLKSVMNYRVP